MRNYFIALCLMFTGSVQAEYIINTGSGGTASTGPVVNSTQFLAGQFTLTDSYIIKSVEGWFGPNSEGTITAVIYNSDVVLPGSELFSQQFLIDSPSTDDYAWDGAFGLSWTLDPGTYWLAFEGQPGVMGWGWMPEEAPDPLSMYAVKPNSPDWVSSVSVLGLGLGMRISAVPVPAAVWLFGSGLIVLISIARRKKS